MIKSIDAVKVKKHVYTVKNFKEFFVGVEGLNVGENGVTAGYGLVDEKVDFGEGIIKIYNLSNRFFGYYNDGWLCEIKDGHKLQIYEIGNIVPCTTQILQDGKKEIVFAGEKACLVGDSVTVLSWQTATVITEHNGRIFSAHEKAVTFSSPFDFSTNSTGLRVAGGIKVDDQAGNVLGLLSQNDKLYVVCSSAVYSIVTDNEFIDFKLKRLYYFTPSVIEKTLAHFSNCLVCVRHNSVYTFSDGKFNKVSNLIQNIDFTVDGFATADDRIYYLPIILNEKSQKTIFSFDFLTHNEGLFSVNNCILEKGYVVIGGKLYKIVEGGETDSQKSVSSNQFTFGAPSQKTLYGISAKTGSACTLVIRGSFGSKKFNLKKGFNEIETKLSSPYFEVTFSLTGNRFDLNNLQFIYSKKGE